MERPSITMNKDWDVLNLIGIKRFLLEILRFDPKYLICLKIHIKYFNATLMNARMPLEPLDLTINYLFVKRILHDSYTVWFHLKNT